MSFQNTHTFISLFRVSCKKYIQINMYIFKKAWRRGGVVITTAQRHSTKQPELRFCAGSNPARGV